jgi:sugar lactone lactonase YvrE
MLSMLSVGHPRPPLLWGLAVLAVAGLSAWAPVAGAAPTPTDAGSRQARTQLEIARAFRVLDALPTVSRGRTVLQGYDAAMVLALQQAESRFLDGTNGRPATVSQSTGPATIVRPGEATVTLTITVKTKYPPPSYRVGYTAVSLDVHGHWQVSWTTMCMLVEAADQLCPPAPAHVEAGDVLPAPAASVQSADGMSDSLVSPGPLAIAPDGGVLVADRGRNQILEWKDGVVTVVAGDVLQGFSGDGGPAVNAELNDPEEIAVSRSGTVYFVDNGNHRVRAVEPDGRIETVAGDGGLGLGADSGDGGPATAAPLNPGGVAVSPGGLLFVSSDSAIRVVRPDGVISTLVQGGPPAGVDVNADGTPTAFFPDSLAVNGQGDVIAFSFSPKELFSVSPSGHVVELAPDYATALSPSPDGTVLVAQHGAGLEQVSGSTVTAMPADLAVAGLPRPIVADGIAEAPDGVTYVDAGLDGFNDSQGLYEIAGGVTRSVTVSSTLASTLPAAGAPGFPAATFPPALASAAPGAALLSCPSSLGVVPFSSAAKATASQLLGGWNSSFSYDLHASDRSWWPGVVGNFAGTGVIGRQTVGAVTPAAGTLYASAIATACGSALVKDSVEVVMGPSAYDFSYQHVYLLDRGGTPLVYFAVT